MASSRLATINGDYEDVQIAFSNLQRSEGLEATIPRGASIEGNRKGAMTMPVEFPQAVTVDQIQSALYTGGTVNPRGAINVWLTENVDEMEVTNA